MTDPKELTAKFFNELAKDIHENENRKWWFDKDGNPCGPSLKTCLVLVISELSEAVEGVRKGLMDDKLPHHPMVAAELADAILRLLDTMEGCNTHRFTGNYKRVHQVNMKEPIQDHIFDVCGSITHFYNVETVVYEILDVAYSHGYDLIPILHEKREYNKGRLDHTDEERAKVGGKKF